MKQRGTHRQTKAGNITQRMRFEYWIIKATHNTHTRLGVTLYYTACLVTLSVRLVSFVSTLFSLIYFTMSAIRNFKSHVI